MYSSRMICIRVAKILASMVPLNSTAAPAAKQRLFMNDAIGWSEAKALALKMGKLMPELVHYVAGRSGDDYMLRIELLELVEILTTILARTVRSDNHVPGKVIFPVQWHIGPVPGDTDVIIQTEEGRQHVARFVGQPGTWEVGGFTVNDTVIGWRPLCS